MQSISILTPDFQWLGEIDDYESLQFTRRFIKPGSFELHINLNKNLIGTLLEENLIVLSEKKVGVILHRELNRENSEELVIRGYTLSGHLSRRLTLPPEGQSQDKVDAPIETVLKHYVRQNAVNPTDTTRIIPQLVIAEDMQRGQVVEWQSRYKQLDEELEKITNGNNFGWDVYLDEKNEKWVFEVLEGRNLTDSQEILPPVIFSIDFDNIKGQNFTQSAIGHKNTAYVGGQGEGEARRIVEISNSSGLSRIETFVDARDVDETRSTEDAEGNTTEIPIPENEVIATLSQRANKKLLELQKIESFESEILTYGPFIYEKDWDVGDTVTVQDSKLGITLDSPITEVTEIYEPGGFRLDAVFGNTLPTLIDKIKRVIEAPMLEKANVPKRTSDLVNDAGYVTRDEVSIIANDKSHEHSQLSPSSSWTVIHNLGKHPSVIITDSAKNIVMGDVKYESINKVVISFTAAFAGKAFFN
ncbi:hypothetical protein CSV79_01525 [Sporosarcina sp. P13]|nr:hypothetical protein CSV79_01525 [Sporosarcina sp. P13]